MNAFDDVDIWHYAVRKGGMFFTPSCASRYGTFFKEPNDSNKIHGQTRLRGLVNCEDCKRMMGMI